MPTAEAIFLGLVSILIVGLLARVRRERLDTEKPPSAATWIGVGLILGFVTVLVVSAVVAAAPVGSP